MFCTTVGSRLLACVPDMQLVLASQSVARRRLLRAAGFRFLSVPSNLVEASLPQSGDFRRRLLRTAEAKAAAVARRFPGAFVIAADTAIRFRHRVFGKPQNLAHAAAMLKMLAGHTHTIGTAVCVIAPRPAAGHRRARLKGLALARVTLQPWSLRQIDRYVARLRPLSWAGGYALQNRRSAAMIRCVRGDRTVVVGLPVTMVRRFLTRLGYRAGTRAAVRPT